MKIDFKKLAKLFWVAAFFIGVVGFNFSPVAKAGLDSDNNNNGKVVICSLGVACGQTINTNVTYSPSATVKAGDQLTINVVFNRAVLDSPAPQISMAGQYTVAATNMTKVDTTHYTFIHNVPNDAIDGTESITISNVDDGFYDSLNGTPLTGSSFTISSFDSGTGVVDDPYIISSCTQLQSMQTNLSAFYKLSQNIDCSDTINWNTGAGFIPVGLDGHHFTGGLDGAGFEIQHLFINSTGDFVGLFGATNGVIKNIVLRDPSITGRDAVGSLAGYNDAAITGVSSVGGTVTGRHDVGGLIGAVENESVTDASSTTDVTGTGSDVGGLIGVVMGSTGIQKVYATGHVVTYDSTAGGLIGKNQGATISDCYATGALTVHIITSGGQYQFGGLIGLNAATINRCYSTGTVDAALSSIGGKVGGLIGENSGNINDSYSVSEVLGIGGCPMCQEAVLNIGGIAGVITNSTTPVFTNVFWDAKAGQPQSCVNAGGYSGCSGVDTTNQPNHWFDTVENTVYTRVDNAWDFTNTWMSEGSYPILRSGFVSFEGGAGTANDPYQISTCAELQAMSQHLTAYYSLTQNIDCTGTRNWNAGAGFEPVGTIGNDKIFIGQFNGHGYTIDGLYIHRPVTQYVGLFGYTQGFTQNLNLTNVDITGGPDTGGIAGRIKESLLSVSVQGTVTGTTYVGGIAGSVEGQILNADSNVVVTGSADYVGGIAGDLTDVSQYLSARGSVTSSGNDVGGIAGVVNNIGQVFDSYSTAPVTETGTGNNVGGAIGFLSGNENSVVIARTYAVGDVTIDNGDLTDGDYFGGLVGYALNNFTISDDFAFNHVENTVHTGGIGGFLDYNFAMNGSISNTVWGSGKGWPAHCVNGEDVTGCTWVDQGESFKNSTMNAPFKNSDDVQVWDFDNVWQVHETDYPSFKFGGYVSYDPSFGYGIAEVQHGRTIHINVNFKSAIPDSPPLKISLSGADTLASTNMTKLSSEEYTYTYMGGSGDGDVIVSITQGDTPITVANNRFVLDNAAPVITAAIDLSLPTNTTSPTYIFNSTRPGVLIGTGECLTHIYENVAFEGQNSVKLRNLSEGTHTCTLQVEDQYTGLSNVLTIGPFRVDTTSPVLSTVSQVPNPTNGANPNFVFTTNEDIEHMEISEGCGVAHSQIPHAGHNIVVEINPASLTFGQTYTCTMDGFDAAGNHSNTLTIGPFVYTAAASSGGGGSVPVGFLSSGSGGSSGGSGGTGSSSQTVSTQETSQTMPTNETQNSSADSSNLDIVPFTDIAGHWAKDFISQLYRMKVGGVRVVEGRSPTLFVPEGNLTRAEAVKIGLLAFGYKLDVTSPSGFTDLNAKAWYVPYLRKAKALGVIGGTKFRPDEAITRSDVLVMYLKMANKSGSAAAAPFTDVDQSSSYAAAVNYAFAKGVVAGRTPTLFVPLGTITRAEIAKIILKIKAL